MGLSMPMRSGVPMQYQDHNLPYPYTPYQNGIVERKNNLVVEMG